MPVNSAVLHRRLFHRHRQDRAASFDHDAPCLPPNEPRLRRRAARQRQRVADWTVTGANGIRIVAGEGRIAERIAEALDQGSSLVERADHPPRGSRSVASSKCMLSTELPENPAPQYQPCLLKNGTSCRQPRAVFRTPIGTAASPRKRSIAVPQL
jgi:hypothetical protein